MQLELLRHFSRCVYLAIKIMDTNILYVLLILDLHENGDSPCHDL